MKQLGKLKDGIYVRQEVKDTKDIYTDPTELKYRYNSYPCNHRDNMENILYRIANLSREHRRWVAVSENLLMEDINDRDSLTDKILNGVKSELNRIVSVAYKEIAAGYRAIGDLAYYRISMVPDAATIPDEVRDGIQDEALLRGMKDYIRKEVEELKLPKITSEGKSIVHSRKNCQYVGELVDSLIRQGYLKTLNQKDERLVELTKKAVKWLKAIPEIEAYQTIYPWIADAFSDDILD